MTIPAKIRDDLAMLREVFLHKPEVQDRGAEWWGKLRLDDRRLLLALTGAADDTTASASRPWRQLSQDARDTLVGECKRLGRLVEGLRWA